MTGIKSLFEEEAVCYLAARDLLASLDDGIAIWRVSHPTEGITLYRGFHGHGEVGIAITCEGYPNLGDNGYVVLVVEDIKTVGEFQMARRAIETLAANLEAESGAVSQ